MYHNQPASCLATKHFAAGPSMQKTAPPFIAVLLTLAVSLPAAADDPLLEHDILPLLTKNCMGCHGGLKQEGGLDLRTLPSMLAGGDSGPAIERGKAGESALWQRIEADEMPPGESKLSSSEKETIRRWISAGMPTVAERRAGKVDPLLAAGEKHDPQQVAETIDRHIDAKLAAAKLSPAERSGDAIDAFPRGPSVEERLAEIRRRIQDAVEYPPLARRRRLEGVARVAFDAAHCLDPPDGEGT